MGQEVIGDVVGVKDARIDGAIGADRTTHFGEQETQEVCNFGRGSYRRTGGADGVLLLDRNCGANVDQPIDIGSIDFIKKHAGISGEGFHVAPLAFGE
jgi:hypothetical protein